MKLRIKVVIFAIASIFAIGQTTNNNIIKKLLVENIEALTDSYENKIDVDGHTLVVHYLGKPMSDEEKDSLKDEMYYIIHGLPNPYRFGPVSYILNTGEYFYNETMQRWELINGCGSDRKLISSLATNGVCWVKY